MRHIKKPGYKVSEIVQCCAGSMKNTPNQVTKIKGYSEAIPELVCFEELFDNAMQQGSVHELQCHDTVTVEITKEDMVSLYNNQFVKNKDPRTKYYEKLLSSSPNHTCPYCAERDVSTLDHFLPKAHYPKLAVSAINLVPSCSFCNKAKTDSIFHSYDNVTLHPYYDDVQNTDWLFASFGTHHISSITFYTVNSDEIMQSRLQTHMKQFCLNELYCRKVAEESSSQLQMWNMLLSMGGVQSLVSILKMHYESAHQNERNCWRAAFYRAMVNQIASLSASGRIEL